MANTLITATATKLKCVMGMDAVPTGRFKVDIQIGQIVQMYVPKGKKYVCIEMSSGTTYLMADVAFTNGSRCWVVDKVDGVSVTSVEDLFTKLQAVIP